MSSRYPPGKSAALRLFDCLFLSFIHQDCQRIAPLIAAMFSGFVFAKLPPPTDDAKARLRRLPPRPPLDRKVALYQLCPRWTGPPKRIAGLPGGRKSCPAPVATAPCANPALYVAVTPASSKPLEASGAIRRQEPLSRHQAPERTAAEIAGGPKNSYAGRSAAPALTARKRRGQKKHCS